MSRNQSRLAVIFIVITVTIESIGFGIIMPVMPQLIVSLTGEDVSHAAFYGGWLLFSYAVMQFICAPVMGNLGDRFGRRPVLLLSLFVLGVDYIIMAMAPTIAWLFVGRIIAGIAGSSFSTANAYIADISTTENRAQNFGLMGAAFGVGFVIGPVIGGLLGEYGPRAPFYAAAVLSLINVLYGFFVLEESLSADNRRRFQWRRANPFGALRHIRSNSLVFGLGIAVFLFMLAHMSLPSVWSYYTIEKFSWSEKQIGYSLGYAGVLMIIVQAVLIRLVIPKLGAFRSAVFGMTMLVIGFAGYATATQGWQLYIWMTVAALSGFVMPAFQSVMTSHTEANSQGELQGAIAAITSLTSILSPLLMTRLFGYFSGPDAIVYFPGISFMTAAGLEMLALLVFVGVMLKASKVIAVVAR
jgi:DHA1 family tetracycline resistance protein-like MFS transporter